MEATVKELTKAIAVKDTILREEGNIIEEMQDEITALDQRLSDTGDELETTRQLLEETQDKLAEHTELHK
ncbi:MAG: hypothetical protein ACKPKO_55520 [Candidatus Fonsibacter sp.]